jgi:hypothetical protein
MFLVLALATAVPFSYDGQMNPGQTLTIRNVIGRVRVRTGDRLAIRATKHAERSDPNAVQIHVETRADGVVVCTRYPPYASRGCDERNVPDGNYNDDDTVVDFEVTIPHGVALNAVTVNGPVDAVADGPINARAVNGAVRAEGRDVREAAAVNGSVVVRILGGGRGSVDATTVNGSIEVSLPPGTGVDVSASTLAGSIDAPGLNVDRPPYGPGARASGTIGDGARRLTLKTLNGSITLRR